MEILIKVLQLILSLSILVILHEFGHFAFARLFNTRVEKFYMFFNPGFSLFKVKKGETEYGIGWLPLGGYVKISGMIDESMDREQMKQPPKPYEFRAKPAWQRLLIMLGGVLVKLILAIVIYGAVLFVWGEKYLPTEEVNKHGIMTDSVAESVGFQDGDKILAVNGKKVERFNNVFQEIILNRPASVTVKRGNQTEIVHIQDTVFPKILNNPGFIQPRVPPIIGQLPESSPAKDAGLEVGDKILAINGEKVNYHDQLENILKSRKGQETDVVVERDGDEQEYTVKVSEEGQFGFYLGLAIEEVYNLHTMNYGLFESIPAGINKGVNTVGSYVKQLGLIFSPDTGAYKEVGSFITIGKIFPGQWDWHAFWNLTALLSIILGVINILPIPALDGGHVMFLTYEVITGRKPSDKFLEYAQIAGMLIILSIFVYAIGNDIVRHLF
ncbi:MAG: RIP metalloprotease RseP [Bacteroidales bacterium]